MRRPLAIRTLFIASFFLCLGSSAFPQTLLHRFAGELGDDLGHSLRPAGDVNKDGHADIVVGAPGLFFDKPGYVRVYSGCDGSVLHEWTGDADHDLFGWSVDGAGDVDGDTYPDIVVGAPMYNPAAPWLNGPGYVRVFSGQDGSILHDLQAVPATGRAGWAVKGAGDVDGNGFDDFLVSDIDYNAVTGDNTGIIYLLDGCTASIIAFQVGADVDYHLGQDLATGDFDGDGVTDYATRSFPPNGGVRAFSGATHQLLFTFPDAAAPVEGVGDVDGDGCDDFVTGDSLVSGSGALIHSFSSVEPPGRLSGLGDFNGDGTPDLLRGESTFLTEIGLYSAVYSGLDYSLMFQIGYPAESIHGVGDVDADGIDDFAVATDDDILTAGGSTDHGVVRVFKGGAPALADAYCTAAPNSEWSQGAQVDYGGTNSISANDLTLFIGFAPEGEFGVLFYGTGEIETPFGDGFLCVGSVITRVNPPVVNPEDFWTVIPLDFTQPPMASGPGEISPGITRNFQYWYRDPAAGGAGFNLSDGLRVTFVP